MSVPFHPIPSGDGCGRESGAGSEPRLTVPEIPIAAGGESKVHFPPLALYPSLPSGAEGDVAAFSLPSWSAPLAKLPISPERNEAKMAGGEIERPVFPSEESAAKAPERVEAFEKGVGRSFSDFGGASPFIAAPPLEPEYSDKDLKEALAPLMRDVMRETVYSGERSTVDAMLEPMLRATVRRALAEYSPANRPFEAPGFMDRTLWRMKALFSSRTFEDVLFEKTHRFQVDEVFLFDAKTLALVSFASCDPARHSTAKRVESSAHRIAMNLRDEAGNLLRSYERADGRHVLAETGSHVLLAAVVRGQPNEVILADLEFCLHRIEEHFQARFEQAGSALMHALQPFLEDCLLIQAPASAA